MTLSLTMIVKEGLEELKRIHPLVKDHIDEWVVVIPPKDKAKAFLKDKAVVIEQDFTQAIEPEIAEKMKQWGIEVPEDYRLFNFAAAREASLQAATGDLILWFDADDVPLGIENIKKFVEKYPETDVFDAVYDYYRDEEGNPISDHVRERVVRNNGKFEWLGGKLGLIHETLLPKGIYEPLHRTFPEEIFRVEHRTDHVEQSSMRNHIALLYEYLKTEGEDPRTTYYLGIEYFNRRMYDFCIKVMMDYVRTGGWDEERYRAWLKIGEAYHMLNQPASGRNAYLAAIDELPHYPDAYLALGESYHNDEEWGKSTEFIMTGLQKKIPQTKSVVDKTKYTFRPSVYIALNYLQLGKPGDAYEWFGRAVKLNPKHPWLKENAALFIEAKEMDDYVKSFVKVAQIAKARYPKTIHKLAEAIPDEIQGQELLLDFKRRFSKPKVWSDKSIVYFCSEAFEDWGPDSLKTGCGGSEEAVIHLTKRWADMGYEVTVFNNCPQEKVVDGVSWQRFERFNPRDIFNVLIAWRNNPFLEPYIANKKLLDMHDVPNNAFYTKESLEDVTVMVKSQYHRSCMPHLDNDNFAIVPNGIDFEQFKDIPDKTPNSLVWTSSYDRGLEYLLEMWPELRKAVPNVTLHVAYGWNIFDASARARTRKGQAWKAKMQQLMQQEGIIDHGRLNSADVAKLYLEADVWAYPTDFSEIDCITATKAMAAKCVPITTDVAALKERNQGVMIEGNAVIPEVKQKFLEELISLLKDEGRKSSIREKLDVAKYSWDEIAKKWSELF